MFIVRFSRKCRQKDDAAKCKDKNQFSNILSCGVKKIIDQKDKGKMVK